MKELLIRGKEKETNKWIYGYFYKYEDKTYIVNTKTLYHEVIPETIGLFTGKLAKKSKSTLLDKVFEGDLFRYMKETDIGDIISYCVVMWINELAAFYLIPIEHYETIRDNDVSRESEFEWLFNEANLSDFSLDTEALTKVGDIHDNFDLLTTNLLQI